MESNVSQGGHMGPRIEQQKKTMHGIVEANGVGRCKLTVDENPTTTTPVTKSTTTFAQTSEVNMVQSSAPKNSQQTWGKKKNKHNKKNTSPEQSGQSTQQTNAGGNKSKRKVK